MSERINIDADWKFYNGDLPPRSDTDGWGGAKARAYCFGAVSYSLDDTKWRDVDLPHDFVSEGDYTQKGGDDAQMRMIPEMESMNSRHFAGGSLEGGIAWYRKKFHTPKECDGKRIYIYFDGIYRDSDVYLNEYYVISHSGGYDSFFADITDFVNMNGENVLAVRVNSSGREGWWYEGGGIYRHVWLEIRDNVSIEPYGIFISSEPNVEQKTAEVTINVKIQNKMTTAADADVISRVYDASGNKCAALSGKAHIKMWDSAECIQTVQLDGVTLWDTDNPYLYTLKTEVYTEHELTDSTEIKFGIRDIYFDAQNGFFLNGKHLKIKGFCCHQDHAGLGIAQNESVMEYRIDRLKSAGANAYRSAHHMPAPELLDLCDRKGMLVFCETRRMSSASVDIDALRTMVKSGRNHPCVFLWGIGNEEVNSQDRIETAKTTVTMKAEIDKLDGTRPITSAVVCWNGKERFDNAAGYVDVTRNLDIMGFNYCKTAWDDYHCRMPKQPIIITEEATSSFTRGCYSTDEAKGHYYLFDKENKTKCKNSQKAVRAIENLGESDWKYCDERDYLAGIFLWTGMDYRGEPTPLLYPAVYSQFGVFDYCGFPKDNFYYYKSFWKDGGDVLHIFPHWNLSGMEGKPVDVYCYTNFESAELLVNGKSCGKKIAQKDWYIIWENVIYNPGEVSVIGYRNGAAAAKKTIRTASAPHFIRIEPYKNEIKKGETAIFNISIYDADGNFAPTADNELSFEICSGKFIGTGNGNPGDHSSEKVKVRRAFNGLCQVLVKADEGEEIILKVYSSGLADAKCKVKVF